MPQRSRKSITSTQENSVVSPVNRHGSQCGPSRHALTHSTPDAHAKSRAKSHLPSLESNPWPPKTRSDGYIWLPPHITPGDVCSWTQIYPKYLRTLSPRVSHLPKRVKAKMIFFVLPPTILLMPPDLAIPLARMIWASLATEKHSWVASIHPSQYHQFSLTLFPRCGSRVNQGE